MAQELIIHLRQSTSLLIAKIFATELILSLIHTFVKYFLVDSASIINLQPTFVISTTLFLLFQILNFYYIISIVLSWAMESYSLKATEVVIQTGIFSKQVNSYELANLQSIKLEQDPIGRLLNFGTVRLYDPTLQYDIYLKNISNPNYYIQLIKTQKSKASENLAFIRRR